MITRQVKKKLILTAILGNIFESYDIAIFVFLAPYIAKYFFAPNNFTDNLFKTLFIFLIGYLARPLGGLLFGMLADIWGRKKSLVLSVLLISITTSLFVILPSYQTIGVSATILLLLGRFLQGLSVGGEYITSVTFLIENAPADKKGWIGSWAAVGANSGVLLASVVCAIVLYGLENHWLPSWAWRIPLVISFFGAIISYWIRANALETAEFILAHAENEPAPFKTMAKQLKNALLTERRACLVIIGLTWAYACTFYQIFTYGQIFQTAIQHLSSAETMVINSISILVLVMTMPHMGALSDKIGRRKLLLWALVCNTLLIYPYYYLSIHGNFVVVLLAQLILTIPCACLFSLSPTLFCEILPVQVRCTMGSLCYSFSASVFGGTAPLVAYYLMHALKNPIAPAYYLMICSIIGICAVLASNMGRNS